MVFVFFGLVATCGTTFVMVGTVHVGRLVVRRGRWACSPSRSWSRTTCATSPPTRPPASARSPSGSATLGPAASTARASSARSRRSSSGCSSVSSTRPRASRSGRCSASRPGCPRSGRWRPSGGATGRDLIPVLTGTALVHAVCGLAMAVGLALQDTVRPGPLTRGRDDGPRRPATSRAPRRSSTRSSPAVCGTRVCRPDSRSAPLALAFARDDRVDGPRAPGRARSAAFFALGVGGGDGSARGGRDDERYRRR